MVIPHSQHRAGDEVLKYYFRDLRRYPPLTRREEEKLLERVKNGDPNALNRLVMSNLRFVVSIAKRYKFINEVPFEELIAVGNLGLVRAARRFDRSRNVRFISYAVWWIRQAIIQTISIHTHPIRLPLNRVHQHLKLKKLEESLTKKLNRRPSLPELAEAATLKVSDLRKFMVDTPTVVSLDGTPVDGDDDLYLRDIIPDSESDPEVQSQHAALVDEIRKVFDSLTEREKIIMKLRFGLQQSRVHTLEEIGKLLGLTRERIRQLESQALQKLRHPSRSMRLDIFRT
ncbi:MAG: sigma-70 family RNA polymerase sigma factor [Candidatus Riflebacteria bacterium]|nr:sigma-70 family RNA polymerase sigma factor [Candidatus Riflebacteria bacterium]